MATSAASTSLRGRLRAGRDPQRAVGQVRIDAHRQQDVARLGAPRVQALPVETSMPSRSSAATRSPPSTPLDDDADVVRQPIVGMAGEGHALELVETISQPAAQLAEAIRLRGRLGARQLERRREADDAGDVLGPGAPLTLLRSALQLRQELGAAADVERSDALRPAELVR